MNNEPQVLIERIFAAPRALVFRAWIDPAQLSKWFAPPGCTIEFRTCDPRHNGSFHSCIRTPTGYECWCVGDYREVTPPERIVFTMAIANARGERMNPADLGMDPAWPAETVVTVTFEDFDGKTKLTLRQTVSEALAKKTGAHPSWLLMLDLLEKELKA